MHAGSECESGSNSDKMVVNVREAVTVIMSLWGPRYPPCAKPLNSSASAVMLARLIVLRPRHCCLVVA
jgi:hypothetical protein